MSLIIGIDPGKTGGIAWQPMGRREYADATGFPDTETDVADVLRQLIRDHETWFAYLERVGATPQMGRTSAFSFGRSYGFIRGLLIGLGIPFEEVTPVKWQAEFGLRQGKKLAQGDVEKHNAIKGKAQQLFPALRITHKKAAALLIAEWGARQFMSRHPAAASA